VSSDETQARPMRMTKVDPYLIHYQHPSRGREMNVHFATGELFDKVDFAARAFKTEGEVDFIYVRGTITEKDLPGDTEIHHTFGWYLSITQAKQLKDLLANAVAEAERRGNE
jgi:hypothetical protein